MKNNEQILSQIPLEDVKDYLLKQLGLSKDFLSMVDRLMTKLDNVLGPGADAEKVFLLLNEKIDNLGFTTLLSLEQDKFEMLMSALQFTFVNENQIDLEHYKNTLTDISRTKVNIMIGKTLQERIFDLIELYIHQMVHNKKKEEKNTIRLEDAKKTVIANLRSKEDIELLEEDTSTFLVPVYIDDDIIRRNFSRFGNTVILNKFEEVEDLKLAIRRKVEKYNEEIVLESIIDRLRVYLFDREGDINHVQHPDRLALYKIVGLEKYDRFMYSNTVDLELDQEYKDFGAIEFGQKQDKEEKPIVFSMYSIPEANALNKFRITVRTVMMHDSIKKVIGDYNSMNSLNVKALKGRALTIYQAGSNNSLYVKCLVEDVLAPEYECSLSTQNSVLVLKLIETNIENSFKLKLDKPEVKSTKEASTYTFSFKKTTGILVSVIVQAHVSMEDSGNRCVITWLDNDISWNEYKRNEYWSIKQNKENKIETLGYFKQSYISEVDRTVHLFRAGTGVQLQLQEAKKEPIKNDEKFIHSIDESYAI